MVRDDETARRIAALKARHGAAARPALARLRDTLAPALDRIAASGPASVPEIGFGALADGRVGDVEVARLRGAGCVIVRNVFTREAAEAWAQALDDYLAQNAAEVAVRARLGDRYGARWGDGPPQIWPIYWSRPQVAARQAPELARVRSWLNRLWVQNGAFDPDCHCAYADRLRRRMPGDARLGIRPHIDGGVASRWLDPVEGRAYAPVLAGQPEAFDPWDARDRVHAPATPDSNGCAAFRAWQGWVALSPQGPGDGTLQLLPDIRALAWVLLRPMAADVPKASLCGAEAGAALWIGGQWHDWVLRALIPIPAVGPGDTVWWHPDLIHAVEPRHGGSSPSTVLYIGSAPGCPRNHAMLAAQLPAFLEGRSPPDFPADNLESMFPNRAILADLSPLGRQQMGVAHG